MGAVQLPDELQRVIERQVAEGRAVSPAAFLEEAVMRLVDEARDEEDEILATVQAGVHDGAPGWRSVIALSTDRRRGGSD